MEEEKTKVRLTGSGDADHIILKDQAGNVWRGTATRYPDDSVYYLFRDEKGNSLTGLGRESNLMLRDKLGSTWRGLIR